jgi:GNAT superfamily N-acetyltransferase
MQSTLNLTAVATLAEARALVPLVERGIAAQPAEWRAQPLPAGGALRLLERHFEAPECVLVVAREGAASGSGAGEAVGLCLTAPFEDPLSLERTPWIAVLYVEARVRRRGIARALVGEARRALRARGTAPLGARAGMNDDARLAVADRLGFTREWEFVQCES